ncbi:adenosine deaminase [Gleimia hominis]|uniref:Adenosine deaminase n=1 Tax=Gleimia hominis TaxID=595468 RepID=A0ABU3ICB9_9ACTO|nr:adenosine deaminase [Gleimia hominis]MDT3767122.1 adenosine deaminase [Gleimia hominis]
MRDLKTLPKAHLHLHFTGSLRPQTMVELARAERVRLPAHLLVDDPLSVPKDSRGWFRFQRSYDAARALVRSETVMRRLVDEAVADDAQEGSVRLEIQVDPTSYAPHVGGLTPALEIVLDQAKKSSHKWGVSVGVIVAASRMRHPLDARTLARLAAQYAGDGPGEVVAFGLSNDETAGETSRFGAAFRIARQAGLPGVPHGGELLGPGHVREVVQYLKPSRLGHGVRATEDPELMRQLIDSEVAFELCPTSNVSLGVYEDLERVPLRVLSDAGAQIALGADDPLLFRSRLLDQYEYARRIGFSDEELAHLASSSIDASFAPAACKRQWQEGIRRWLSTEL